MPITKPYHRNYRMMTTGDNSGYSDWAYIVDHEYSQCPEHYTRAFMMIQSDLSKLFEYVEPCDENLKTHSYRVHELLMRTCIEVEANFKSILRENVYSPEDKNGNVIDERYWTMKDYKKINKTHHLSSYKVTIPTWTGEKSVYQPFKDWINSKTLSWYDAYNSSKHDRLVNFRKANFENLILAVTGLLALLSSQFRTENFSSGESVMGGAGDSYYSGVSAIGGFFRIEFPKDWEVDEMYDFNWSNLKKESERFQKINYNEV